MRQDDDSVTASPRGRTSPPTPAEGAVSLFAYGTLIDPDVQRAVIGRAIPGIEARLIGFRRVGAPGGDYPLAVPRPGAWMDGHVLESINDEELTRLIRYEGAEYKMIERRVWLAAGGVRMAHVFVAATRPASGAPDWHLETWRRTRKVAFLRMLRGGA